MIYIFIRKNRISVCGHARAAPAGKDIVCAAVSVLVQTTIRSLEELTDDKIQYEIDSGNAVIRWENLSDPARVLIDSLVLGLESIAESYPKNIRLGTAHRSPDDVKTGEKPYFNESPARRETVKEEEK